MPICHLPTRNVRSIEAWKQNRMRCGFQCSLHFTRFSTGAGLSSRTLRYCCFCDNSHVSKRWNGSLRYHFLFLFSFFFSSSAFHAKSHTIVNVDVWRRATQYNVTCLLRHQTNVTAIDSCPANGYIVSVWRTDDAWCVLVLISPWKPSFIPIRCIDTSMKARQQPSGAKCEANDVRIVVGIKTTNETIKWCETNSIIDVSRYRALLCLYSDVRGRQCFVISFIYKFAVRSVRRSIGHDEGFYAFWTNGRTQYVCWVYERDLFDFYGRSIRALIKTMAYHDI